MFNIIYLIHLERTFYIKNNKFCRFLILAEVCFIQPKNKSLALHFFTQNLSEIAILNIFVSSKRISANAK